jgi:hypothetical protein
VYNPLDAVKENGARRLRSQRAAMHNQQQLLIETVERKSQKAHPVFLMTNDSFWCARAVR